MFEQHQEIIYEAEDFEETVAGRQPQQTRDPEVKAGGIVIPQVSTFRILGLLIQKDGAGGAELEKVQKTVQQAFRTGSCHLGLGHSGDSRPRNGVSTVDTPCAGFCAVARKALYIENRDRLCLESLSSFSLSPRRALITDVLKSRAPTVNCERQKAGRGFLWKEHEGRPEEERAGNFRAQN
ncbi:hypothetical protein MTO96_005806 [Rhipicephalus appendiculatus]